MVVENTIHHPSRPPTCPALFHQMGTRIPSMAHRPRPRRRSRKHATAVPRWSSTCRGGAHTPRDARTVRDRPDDPAGEGGRNNRMGRSPGDAGQQKEDRDRHLRRHVRPVERHRRGLVLPDAGAQHGRHHVDLRPDLNQRAAPDFQLWGRALGRFPRRSPRPPDLVPLELYRHAGFLHRVDGMFCGKC